MLPRGSRTGLHTGECDIVNGSYAGLAVDLAIQIGDHCELGEILVSRTVTDLVAGSGLEFIEFGVRSFDDFGGGLRLFKTVR